MGKQALMTTGYRRANTLLSSRPGHHVPDSVNAIDADSGVHICGADKAMAGATEFHDLAWDSDEYGNVYDAARRRE